MKNEDIFLIVGLGLMGGSYALGLSRAGYRVLAIDKNEESLAYAKKQNFIEEGAFGKAAEKLVTQADFIVLALYPTDVLPWLLQNKALLKKGAIITDLCGVKGLFTEEAQNLLGTDNEFIGSHPMAGKEVSGVQNANLEMFTAANFIITPTAKNTQKGIEFAVKLAKTLKFARITQLNVQEHDKMIAHVSQLTHAIAVSLMNANDDPRLPEVTGDSFKELTRIANINAELWSELFLSNAPALLEEIDIFTSCLNNLRSAVAQSDETKLKEMFYSSTKRRSLFEGDK